MNLRVLALQKKQVALMGPEGDATGEFTTQEVIDAANDSVKSFFGLLDKRRADVNTITRGTIMEAIRSIGRQWAV